MKKEKAIGPQRLTAGVSGSVGSWTGVIRYDGKEVWRCPHSHTNRHETSITNPISAYSCVSHVLDALLDPTSTQRYGEWLNGAYFTRGYQARHANLILRLHKWADAQVDALRAAIHQFRLCA